MADPHVALKDGNSVASAIFESSTSTGVILRGQIDPILGRILVTNAGVISVGYQQAVGTVDGSNTIFVFAKAPNVVSVDQGRVMQKVSSDGTVNWTGTTTITLTIAPNFDIFGVA